MHTTFRKWLVSNDTTSHFCVTKDRLFNLTLTYHYYFVWLWAFKWPYLFYTHFERLYNDLTSPCWTYLREMLSEPVTFLSCEGPFPSCFPLSPPSPFLSWFLWFFMSWFCYFKTWYKLFRDYIKKQVGCWWRTNRIKLRWDDNELNLLSVISKYISRACSLAKSEQTQRAQQSKKTVPCLGTASGWYTWRGWGGPGKHLWIKGWQQRTYKLFLKTDFQGGTSDAFEQWWNCWQRASFLRLFLSKQSNSHLEMQNLASSKIWGGEYDQDIWMNENVTVKPIIL